MYISIHMPAPAGTHMTFNEWLKLVFWSKHQKND